MQNKSTFVELTAQKVECNGTDMLEIAAETREVRLTVLFVRVMLFELDIIVISGSSHLHTTSHLIRQNNNSTEHLRHCA